MTVAELVARFRVEGLGKLTAACEVASQSLRNVRRSVDDVGSAFGDLGKLASAGFVAMTGGLLGLTKAGFHLELVSRRAAFSLANIFGSVELGRQAMERLIREAEKSQLQLSDMIPLFTKLSGAFMAAFKDPQAAMEQSFRTLRVIGDVASSMQLPLEAVQRMSLALTQMTAKPFLVAEELRQLAEATQLPIYDIMQRALARMGKQVTFDRGALRKAQVEGAQAAVALVEELDRMFGGAQEKMVNTFEGAMSNLRDAWARFSRELVRGGIDPITQSLIGLKEKFAELADEAERTGKLRDAFGEFARSILMLTAVAIAAVDTFANLQASKQKAAIRTTVYGTAILGLVSVISLFISGLLKVVSVLLRFAQGILRIIGYLPRLARWLVLIATRLGVWGWVATGVIAALGLMIRYWDQVRAAAWRAAAAVVDAMRTVVRTVGAAALSIGAIVKSLVQLKLPDVSKIYREQAARMEQATKGMDVRATEGYKRAIQAAEQASRQAAKAKPKKGEEPGVGWIEAIKQFPARIQEAYNRLAKIRIAQPSPGRMAEVIQGNEGVARSSEKAARAASKHGSAARSAAQAIAQQESAIEALVEAMQRAEFAGQALDSMHREALETLSKYKDGTKYLETYLRILSVAEYRQVRLRMREDIANLQRTLALYQQLGDIELARELVQLLPAIPAERLAKLGLDAYGLLADLARERKQLEEEIDQVYDRQRQQLQAIKQLSEFIVDTQAIVLAQGDRRLAQLMQEYKLGPEAAKDLLKLQTVLTDIVPDVTELSRYIQVYREYGRSVAEIVRRFPGINIGTARLLASYMDLAEESTERYTETLRKLDQVLITTGQATNELYSQLPKRLRSELASTLSESLTLGKEYEGQLRWILAQLAGVDMEVATQPMLDQLGQIRTRVVDMLRALRETLAVTKQATPEQRQWLDILTATLSYLEEAIERGTEELNRYHRDLARAQSDYLRFQRELEIDRREHVLRRQNDLKGLIALYQELIDQLWLELQLGRAIGLLTYEQQAELERRVESYRRAMEDAQDRLRERNRRLVTELEQGIKGAFVGFFERILSGTGSLRNAFKQLLADIRQAIARMIAEWIVGRIVAWWKKTTSSNPAEEALTAAASGVIRGGSMLNVAMLGLVGVLMSGRMTLGKALAALAAALLVQSILRRRASLIEGLVDVVRQPLDLFRVMMAQYNVAVAVAMAGLVGVIMQGKITLGKALAILAATLAAQAAFGKGKSGSWISVALQVIAGFLQRGGEVQPYRAYIVGEQGPELFIPSTPGRVIPSLALAAQPATVNVSVSAHFYGDFRYQEDINRVADQLASLVVRKIRSVP